MQTRKWQDQSGQDRYTTEVALQGFNSVLTMLDRALPKIRLPARWRPRRKVIKLHIMLDQKLRLPRKSMSIVAGFRDIFVERASIDALQD